MEAAEQIRLLNDPVFFSESFLGWKAHLGQELIMKDQHKVKIVCTGRQFGKSEMLSADLIYKAVTEPGSIQYVVSLTQDQANIIFNRATAMLQESRLKDLVEKISYGGVKFAFPTIQFKNGSVVFAQSVGDHGDYLRGHHAHRIIVDEAAFVKESIILKVILPMLWRHDGELVFISTPRGRNWFHKWWQMGREDSDNYEPAYKAFRFTSYDNPHLSKEAIDRDKASMSEQQIRQEIYAEFIDDANFMFKWEMLDECTENYPVTSRPEPGHSYCMGVDLAKDVDFTVIVTLDITDQNNVKVADLVRFNNKSYEYVSQKIVEVATAFQPVKIWIDASSAGSPVVDRLSPILPQIEGYTFANTLQNPKKFYLMDHLRLGFAQKRLKIPASEKMLGEELRFFELVLEEDSPVYKMRAASGHHDDTCFVAGTLISTPRGQVPIEKLRIGDEVVTRKGTRKIAMTGNRLARVIDRFGFTGTPDHPVFTSKGIKKLKSVKATDVTYIWNPKSSSIEKSPIGAIRNRNAGNSEFITGTTANGSNHLSRFIDKFGWITSVPSRLDWSSTTWMKTHSTMNCLTSNCSNAASTQDYTWTQGAEDNPPILSNGTVQQSERHSNEAGGGVTPYVNMGNTMPISYETPQNTATYVYGAPLLSSAHAYSKSNTAPKNVESRIERVYNISVEGEPEYFANFILVHNCIALALAWQHVAVPMGPITVLGAEVGEGDKPAGRQESVYISSVGDSSQEAAYMDPYGGFNVYL